MQLPVKAHYATLAMLALANSFGRRELMPARLIAQEHKIPSQFLGQILGQLRSAGLIESTRGASGGFQLKKTPHQISIAEVVDAVCSTGSASNSCDDASPLSDVVHEVWEELRSKQRDVLENLTLDDLLKRSENPNAMFYI